MVFSVSWVLVNGSGVFRFHEICGMDRFSGVICFLIGLLGFPGSFRRDCASWVMELWKWFGVKMYGSCLVSFVWRS